MLLTISIPNYNTLGIEHSFYYWKVPLMYQGHFETGQRQFMSIFKEFDKWYILQINRVYKISSWHILNLPIGS